MKRIQFLDFNCEIIKGKYAKGQNSLQLIDVEDGGPVATASVCLPDQPQQENQVFIKNYSENAGIMETLMLQGIISGPQAVIPGGHVNFTVHELL